MGTWTRYNTVLSLYFTFRNSIPDPDDDNGLTAVNVQSGRPPWDMTKLALPGTPWSVGDPPAGGGLTRPPMDSAVLLDSTVLLFMLISNILLAVPELITMFRIRWELPSANSLVMTGDIEPLWPSRVDDQLCLRPPKLLPHW